MSKRITCITLFDENSINKIRSLIGNTNKKLCKVPYLEDDRLNVDTLPYHITIQTWNEYEIYPAKRIK